MDMVVHPYLLDETPTRTPDRVRIVEPDQTPPNAIEIKQGVERSVSSRH
jgi:hypothetical protein